VVRQQREWAIVVCPEHGMVDENECRLENDLSFTHRPSVIGPCDRPCERVTVVPKGSEVKAYLAKLTGLPNPDEL
jgi:hypothetical protein